MEENYRPINQLLKIAMDSLKELIDVNIIVGEKITYNNLSVVPISKVKCGFVSGGIDQNKKYESDDLNPFGGGAGGTVTITPVAFLAFVDNDVKILHLDDNPHVLEKIIDFIPQTIKTITKMIKKENGPNVYTYEKQ